MSLITVIHIYLKIECIKNRKKINCGKDINDKNLYNLSKKKKKLYKNFFISSSFFTKKKKQLFLNMRSVTNFYISLFLFQLYVLFFFKIYVLSVFQFSLYIPLKNNLFTFIIIFVNIYFLKTRFSNYS